MLLSPYEPTRNIACRIREAKNVANLFGPDIVVYTLTNYEEY